jgi:hypothetical protein
MTDPQKVSSRGNPVALLGSLRLGLNGFAVG